MVRMRCQQSQRQQEICRESVSALGGPEGSGGVYVLSGKTTRRNSERNGVAADGAEETADERASCTQVSLVNQ